MASTASPERIGAIRGHADQIREVETHFVLRRVDPHRIGDRLVDSRHPKVACIRAGRIRRQAKGGPGREVQRVSQLPRDEHVRRRVSDRFDARSSSRGKRDHN